MAQVIFSTENELISELKKNNPKPIEPLPHERAILRIAALMKPIVKGLPTLNRYYLLATMKAPNGDILRLERYCGDSGWGQEGDDKTYNQAEKVREAIEQVCKELYIDVRGGHFE